MIKSEKCSGALLKNSVMRSTLRVMSKRGFTLIEMMLVMVIIGIFSSLTVVNFRGNEKNSEVKRDALSLVDGIGQMQTAALSGQIINGNPPTKYFVDIENCLTDCQFILSATVSGADVVLDTVDLDNSIVQVFEADSSSASSGVNIALKPPRGNLSIFADGDTDSQSSISIKLSHKSDTSIIRTISISSITGRVDIE